MIDFLFALFDDKRMLAMIFAAVAAGATVITLAMPLLGGDGLEKRMAAVAAEREKIRQRERERLARGDDKTSRRASPKQYMQTVVDKFKLSDWLGEETARTMLVQAGFRGHSPYVVFLFFRLVAPIVMLVGSLIYVFLLLKLDLSLDRQGRHLPRRHLSRRLPAQPFRARTGLRGGRPRSTAPFRMRST